MAKMSAYLKVTFEMRRILEVCCGDVGSVAAAVKGGADRIELCCALSEGGLTPSAAMIRMAVKCRVPVNVLIRPRRGDFLYSEEEVDVMAEDIKEAVRLGASGFVIGALDRDGNVDMASMRKMVEAAGNANVTFHRAFDLCRDPEEALESAIKLGCDTILTSGLRKNALEGAGMIRRLHELAKGRISVMAGCGVNPGNAAEILQISGADAIHGTASAKIGSEMTYRSSAACMGAECDEYSRNTTDPDIVAKLREIVGSFR